MKTVSRKEWQLYISRLERINKKAVEEFSAYITEYGGYQNIPRRQLIGKAYQVAAKYGSAAASLSAEAYDAVALAQGAAVPAAVPAETIAFSQVAKTVNGIIKNTGSEPVLEQSVGLMAKSAGVKTTIQNAARDGAEIAYIANGDTCVFCMMIAAQGWRKASLSELDKDGEPVHLHANCDCTYGVRFNKSVEYAGYDPQKYKDKYDSIKEELGGGRGKSKEVLRAWRREIYDENAEKINEQKRSAYEKSKEREASAAEEYNVNG